MLQEHLNHLYHQFTGQRETYDKLKLQHPKRWITSMSNELGRLASGVGDIMTYSGRKATYSKAVCDYRLLKDEPYRVRPTVGGDILIYPGYPGAHDASILDSKTIFNSTI